MKRLFSTSALLIFLIVPALAQVKVGLKAGGSHATQIYRNYDNGKDHKFSSFKLHAGIFGVIPLHNKVIIQPELLYIAPDLYSMLKTNRYAYSTLNLSLLAGYKASPKLIFLAGPEFRYLTSSYYIEYGHKSFEAGANIGLNYNLWKQLSIDFRYVHGLTNLVQQERFTELDSRLPDYIGGRSQSIRLGLAYTFGKNTHL